MLGVVLVVLAGSAVAAWWYFVPPRLPEPKHQSADEVVNFVASEDFRKLPEPRRQEYIRKVRKAYPGFSLMQKANMRSLTEEQRHRFHRNFHESRQREMNNRIEKYFKLPVEQRTAYMDEMIDGMQRRMSQPRRRPPTTRPRAERSMTRPSRRRRRRDIARFRRRYESSDPVRRAQRVEFFKALRKRMEERGISWPRRRRRR